MRLSCGVVLTSVVRLTLSARDEPARASTHMRRAQTDTLFVE
jgi:hypothetical protein